MKFWIQFTTEQDDHGTLWHNAYSPDFDAVTQGHSLEECREMALDLLHCHLEAQVFNARRSQPLGEGWEQLEVQPQ